MGDNDWITGNIVLRISGEPVELQMTVPTAPVKPQRMLPIFQQLASRVVDSCVEAVEDTGKQISCKAGCGACCRQAVPIAEIEAYQLAELVEAMDEPRKTRVKQRFSETLAHFRKIKWFDELIDLKDMAWEGKPGFSPAKYNEVVVDYMKQGYSCPFLEDESCSIHPDRPVVCREYLVTSPAENCASPTAETIERVPIFLKMSKALLTVGNTENTEGMSSLTLIEALDFVEQHPDKFETKTGQEWTKELIEQLTKAEVKPDEPPKTRRRRKPRHK